MMEDSPKFLSIDEQAISDRSVNPEEASCNLKVLQKHIFQPKFLDFPNKKAEISKCSAPSSSINVKSSLKDSTTSTTLVRPTTNESSIAGSSSRFDSKFSAFERKDHTCSLNDQLINSTYFSSPSKSISRHATAMESGGKEIILPSGKGNLFDRQPSVNDEDLFGYGKNLPDENQEQLNYGNLSNEYTKQSPEHIELNMEDNDDKSEKYTVVDSGIPNFGLLESSSGSESDSSKSRQSSKSTEGNKMQNENQNITKERHSNIEFSDGRDSSYQMRFLDKRSISAVDRREKYRISSGGEVFYPDIDYVENDSYVRNYVKKSNSLPDLIVSSNPSPLSPPQFNSNPNPKPAVEENLAKQYGIKMMMEGTSSMPQSRDIPKVRRSVSIKEEPEYFPADNHDGTQDEENQNGSSKQTDERRRILSSGYQTASSEAGSQDKSDITASRQTSQISHSSSGVWTSQEGENENAESVLNKVSESDNSDMSSKDQMYFATNLSLPNSMDGAERNTPSPSSCQSGGNESNSTESSVNTVQDAQEASIDKTSSMSSNNTAMQAQNSSRELPMLSVFGPGDSSRKFNRLLSKDEKNGARSKIPPSVETKQPESYDPPSHGNLPNFLHVSPESFSIKGSSLEKVNEEEDKNHRVVINRYCNDASLGNGQLPSSSITPSSRGSISSNQPSPPEAVRRWDEMLMKLGPDTFSPSILDKIHQEVFGSSLSPYNNNEREKIEGAGSQNFKDFSLDELEKASRCNFQACKELCCLKMREILRMLRLDIPQLDPSFALVKKYFSALNQHCYNVCDETKCSVLFCAEFEEWNAENQEVPEKHFVEETQRIFRHPTMKLFPQTSNKFHKLQSHIQKDEMKEFETHVPMFPLGKFHNHNVCMDNKLQKLVVLTFYPLMDNDHQLSLYARLKDLNDPHIVPQLWLLEYDDKIQVCSLFCQGGSLEDYLSYVKVLSWPRVIYYMKQILSAIIYLNSSFGVVYLNWKSGNMLFPDDRHNIIQVSNFSLSCPVNCQCDIGSVKACLPYYICPPELLERTYKADCRSDIWGDGCLFYEMLSGTPFLYEHRHEERDVIHRKIFSGLLPNTDTWSIEIRKILNSCWKAKMEDRKNLDIVLRYIKSLKVK